MSQTSFALPDPLRYDMATPSDLETTVEMCVATPYNASSPVVLILVTILL